jgi:hypothetical protein
MLKCTCEEKTLCILWCFISSQERCDRIIRIRRVKTNQRNQNAKIRMPPSPCFVYLSFLSYSLYPPNKIWQKKEKLWYIFIYLFIYGTVTLRHSHVLNSLNFSSCPFDLYRRANFEMSYLTTAQNELTFLLKRLFIAFARQTCNLFIICSS